ncbi:HAMP domain-containing histidine kinase [Candidatus Saccharibacteria bacterium]|nr:HAMP domain-containing histidine kinase [Candidatus Saccharibacteria bacterium]
MEVNKKTKKPLLVRDYLGKFQKRAFTIILAASLGLAVCIVSLLAALELVPLFSMLFWSVFIFIILLLGSIISWLFWELGKPFRDLVQTVVMIEGAPTARTPPNPNDAQYADSGFGEILQTLYEMAANQPEAVIEKLPDEDDTLRTGLNQTPSGIVILNENKKIVYSNSNAPVNINQAGEKLIDVYFPETDTLELWIDEQEKKAVHSEYMWTRVANKTPGSHSRRIYDIVASYQKGSKAETVLTFFDRTEAYAPEEDDLDFISFAAHELRGPITVIRGYLDVLEEELRPVFKDDQVELMQRLIVSSNRLSSYINNILNAARYDRRHFKIQMNEENIATIYKIIRDDMQLRAISQNRLLSVDIPDNLPTVAADKNSVGEVLSNLIDNAIKYSNEGGQVVVTAKAVSQFIEVTVKDRGIGMPSSVLPNLFHKFYRSHRSRETVAGTGIGLYISKAIVESHGGSIEVRSTESEGSIFSFTLPIYSTVADKIKASNNSNELLIKHGSGWIRNHSMYRG